MTITALRQVLVLALTLTLLNGCSLFTPKGGQDALQGELDDLSHWQARGKLSVRSPDDSVTGYLDWKQNQRDFDLYIAGPLGSGATRLSGTASSASLTLPGWGAPREAQSPEELMSLYMGWDFPVSDIRYWVKGQPSPNGTFNAEYDEHGLLSQLTQYDWTIRYSRFSQQSGRWLPGLIKIEGHDFRFTFSIREWTLYD